MVIKINFLVNGLTVNEVNFLINGANHCKQVPFMS